jgi:hypothetical protein
VASFEEKKKQASLTFTIVLYLDEKIDGEWKESEIEFSNPSEAGADYELTEEEESGFSRVVGFYGSGGKEDIRDGDTFAQWWREFLKAPLRNVRIGTDEFRHSRAGLIPYDELLSMAEYALLESTNLGNFSLIELLELMCDRCCRDEDRQEAAKSTVTDPGTSKKPEAPFLGLVFNHDSTVSRQGDDYKHIPPIPLAPQRLKLLKFIHEAGERGRTVAELVPRIVANKRILTSEKSRLDLSEIDIDLGENGQYVVRCTKQK